MGLFIVYIYIIPFSKFLPNILLGDNEIFIYGRDRKQVWYNVYYIIVNQIFFYILMCGDWRMVVDNEVYRKQEKNKDNVRILVH